MRKTIVFDTNVLVSGYLWEGKPRRAIKLIRAGGFGLLYCTQSLDELIRVLSSKFGLAASEIYRILQAIKSIGRKVNVTSKENPIKEDLSDNLFINLAIDGSADIIVSGDRHLLTHKEHKGIEIITVTDFISRYS